jgi:hypothetical protein
VREGVTETTHETLKTLFLRRTAGSVRRRAGGSVLVHQRLQRSRVRALQLIHLARPFQDDESWHGSDGKSLRDLPGGVDVALEELDAIAVLLGELLVDGSDGLGGKRGEFAEKK